MDRRNFRDLSDRNAVLKAIEEYDLLGRDAFFEKYKDCNYGKARDYFLLYRGKHYDSKAIVGVAYGHQFGKPLSAYDNFSGGKNTVVPKLRELGFIVKKDKPGEQEAELPQEVDLPLYEGAKRTININSYERNPVARKECIAYHGATCAICKIDFGTEYDEEFRGLIIVHHVCPISSARGEYRVDPEKDLVPVCPNCHAVIHFGGKTRTVDEVRKLWRARHSD